jgi:hypothetical protein
MDETGVSHLCIVPLTLARANQLVGEWHRHHKLAIGHRWSIGVTSDGVLCGAAIVGRPVARVTPQYSIAEVSRLVTDGHQNACSIMYAACARAAQAMGFDEIQTFILESEPGISLRAAGWTSDPEPTTAEGWSRPSRKRDETKHPPVAKRRYWKRLRIE